MVVRKAVNLLNPVPDVLKRFSVRNVIYHDNAVRTAVIRRRNGLEALLPRRVPLRLQKSKTLKPVTGVASG